MAISNQISNTGSFKYVVTGNQPGSFHTIQSALDYVNALGVTSTVFVRPGTYTENLTLYSGINIQGSEEGQVIIVGVHTPPAAGTFSISNIQLNSATHVFSSAAAGTTVLSVNNCTFNLTSGYVFNITNWTGNLSIDNCNDISADNHIIVNTASAALDITNSSIGSGVTTLACSGVTRIFNSRIFCPATFSLTATVLIDSGSRIDAGIATLNTATVSIFNTVISSGAATGITHNSTSLLTLSNVTIDSSAGAVIDGTGTVSLGEVVYPSSNTVAGTIVYDNSSELQCSNIIANDNILATTGDVTIGTGRLYLGVSSGTDGQIPVAATGASPVWASLTAGTGIAITPGANTISIASTVPFGIIWAPSAGVALVAGHGYIVNSNSLQTFTLPAAPTVGDTYIVTSWAGYGAANAWRITNDANHSIQIGNVTVGSGTSYIESSAVGDCITLVCVYDSGGGVYSFSATSVVGNITMNP